MRYQKLVAVGTAFIASVAAPGLDAAPIMQSLPSPVPRAQLASISLDLPVLGPFAYVHFCVRYPDECRVRARAFRRPRTVQLDSRRWGEIVQVNAMVNRSITPHEYKNDTTYDTWRISPREGDCNDYAVTKRHELLARGWPSRSVLLSEVITIWGEHHLVLLVRTDQGDFVLDNLHREIRRWSVTGYQWVRVQSPNDPQLWSTIVTPTRRVS